MRPQVPRGVSYTAGGGAKFGIFATAARDKTVTKIITKITIKLCNCQQKL